MEVLRKAATSNTRKRARLCTHASDADTLHEMIIVLCRDTYIQPHRHLHKSESFHVIQGRLDIVIYADDGAVTRVVKLGDLSSGLAFYYRMNKPCFHTVVIHSEDAVIHETTNGPFVKSDTEYASWAPGESEMDAASAFMQVLRNQLS